VNDLRDAGFGFDWPGMICPDHEGGRTIGLLDMNLSYVMPIAVIPCQTTVEGTIMTALDMLTYPGGIDAWYAARLEPCATLDCTTNTLTPGSIYCDDCNGRTGPEDD
jgi:hypothetical protein